MIKIGITDVNDQKSKSCMNAKKDFFSEKCSVSVCMPVCMYVCIGSPQNCIENKRNHLKSKIPLSIQIKLYPEDLLGKCQKEFSVKDGVQKRAGSFSGSTLSDQCL